MDDLIGKEILLGTYEAFVLGYKLSDDKKSLVSAIKIRVYFVICNRILDSELNFENLSISMSHTNIFSQLTSFADHAHSGSVRAVAAADKFMITSGDDENVKVTLHMPFKY